MWQHWVRMWDKYASMPTTQHLDSLLISIHPPRTLDASKGQRPTGRKCLEWCTRSLATVVPHRGDKESPWDIKEHRAAIRQGEMEKSARAEHAWSQQHPILWEETSVLNQASNNATLLIKEALHIHLSESELINRDKSVTIPDCWRPILSHVTTMTSPAHATPCQEANNRTMVAT